MTSTLSKLTLLISLSFLLLTPTYAKETNTEQNIAKLVNPIVQNMMKQHQIPGVAVAVTVNGQDYFYNYGVASLTREKPITNQTLFNINSVTKTFTTTLASYLQQEHQLALNNQVVNYLPELKNSPLANNDVTLLNLATHTSSLPMTVPKNITTPTKFISYLKALPLDYLPVGSRRIYSNTGIGLLGLVIGQGSNQNYESQLSKQVLKPLGLTHTYFVVPKSRYKNYAIGYSQNNKAIKRAKPGLLPAAYGLKSDSQDLIKYLQANMNELPLATNLQQAITDTHIGYYKISTMTQDLAWEQLPYPSPLVKLEEANDSMVLNGETAAIEPPTLANSDVIINKTGSGHGFASYVIFNPKTRTGVVILANKFYPVSQQVAAGYQILSGLMAMKAG